MHNEIVEDKLTDLSPACPKCHAMPPFAARVCPYCGFYFKERVAAGNDVRAENSGYRCSRCKSPLVEGGRFCSTCGREFIPMDAADSLADLEGPDRYISGQRKHTQALVNTFIQTTGTLVLASSLVFVVYLCTR